MMAVKDVNEIIAAAQSNFIQEPLLDDAGFQDCCNRNTTILTLLMVQIIPLSDVGVTASHNTRHLPC
jgi:hypothetical protein